LPLLVGHSTKSTGRRYSPHAFVSNFIGLSTMPGRRHQLGNDRFGLQVIISVVVVSFGAHGSIEALDYAA